MTAPPDWMKQARCRGENADVFFPPPSDHTQATIAKHICHDCPVKTECRDYALADPTIAGIWGETSYRDRLTIRRQQEKARA